MRSLKFRAYQKTPSLNHKSSLYEVTGLDFYEGDYGGGEVCLRNKKGEQWTEYIKDVVLEQYTGLKDKNGKEIYEGDILKFIKDPEMARVVWNTPSAEFRIKWLECGVSDSLSWHLHAHGGAEVIGTIHENPELLEGEE